MKIIEITFEGYPKRYAYLLNNPSNFRIYKTKPLFYVYGCDKKKLMVKNLKVVNVYSVSELPAIVTSQITIIDNKRHIDIQPVGAASIIEPKKETTTSKKEVKTEVEEADDDSVKKDEGYYRAIRVSRAIGSIFFR